MVSSSHDRLDQELQHIKSALQACQFPNWALNQWHHRFINNNQVHNNNPTTTNNTNQDNNPTKRNITLVVSFIPGTSEKFKKLCKAKGIQVHYKGTNTLRTLLGNPKDKDPNASKTGIIHHYKCPHINCLDAYIRESGRAVGDRIKEHLKAPSPIHQHSTTTGHPLDPEHFNIVHKEINSHSRTIKESYVHSYSWPYTQQEPGQIPTTAYMGPPTTGIANTTAQAFQPPTPP